LFDEVAKENPQSIKRLEMFFEKFEELSPEKQKSVIETFEAQYFDTSIQKEGFEPYVQDLLDELAKMLRSAIKS
jgi:molecular chaperone DnaK (HSP70)